MPVTITIEMLRKKNACEDALRILKAAYGVSKTYQTPEELAADVAANGRLNWAAGTLLNCDTWKAYVAAKKPHQDAYEAATKPHQKAFLTVKNPQWFAYEAAIKPHRDAYVAACSLEFAKLYFQQESNLSIFQRFKRWIF